MVPPGDLKTYCATCLSQTLKNHIRGYYVHKYLLSVFLYVHVLAKFHISYYLDPNGFKTIKKPYCNDIPGAL